MVECGALEVGGGSFWGVFALVMDFREVMLTSTPELAHWGGGHTFFGFLAVGVPTLLLSVFVKKSLFHSTNIIMLRKFKSLERGKIKCLKKNKKKYNPLIQKKSIYCIYWFFSPILSPWPPINLH